MKKSAVTTCREFRPPVEEPRFALGRHLTVEYYDCDPGILLNRRKVEQACVAAVRKGGAAVLGSSFHAFEPQGVSGVVFIPQSHLSFHAWPEHSYAAVDYFAAGGQADFDRVVSALQTALAAEVAIVSNDVHRGIVSNNGVEKRVPVGRNRTHVYTLSWREKFERSKAWGIASAIDLYECDPATIRDEQAIRRFVLELCDRIEMKRFGETTVVDFGEDERVAGFSMTQLIETSLVSGHFANASNAVYLDVFSCKFYEPRTAAEFAATYFKAKHYQLQVALRR
jgi:S-adenosylmethionine decarboxylase